PDVRVVHGARDRAVGAFGQLDVLERGADVRLVEVRRAGAGERLVNAAPGLDVATEEERELAGGAHRGHAPASRTPGGARRGCGGHGRGPAPAGRTPPGRRGAPRPARRAPVAPGPGAAWCSHRGSFPGS